jgi:site-specific DNA-methyltransferase (adenine-specific)
MDTIYNDDCFNVFDQIEKDSINLVLVDLPYGQTACEWDSNIDLNKMWEHLKQICKDKCQYVFFTTTKFGNDLINSNPKWFRYDIVWEKTHAVGFLSVNKQPLRIHEMVYIFSNPSKTHKIYTPQKTAGLPYKCLRKTTQTQVYSHQKNTLTLTDNPSGDRFPVSILKYGHTDKKLHPTQKPSELCEWLIKSFSNEDDVVLDFCMGSGTTVIACINTKRHYIGIEKDADIFKIAEDRIEKHKST